MLILRMSLNSVVVRFGLGGIGFTMKVWQALLDLSVTAQVP